MTDSYTKENKLHLERARNASQKFNYFFVSLTFSVLALAINHGVPIDLKVPLITGLLGWLLLLVSGFFGILRLEYEVPFFRIAALLAEIRGKKADYDLEVPEGAARITDPDLSNQPYVDEIAIFEEKLEKINLGLTWKYCVQKWCFFFGVASLVISYAYPIVCVIFQKAPIVETALKSLQ